MANKADKAAFHAAARAALGVDAYASEPHLFDVARAAASAWLADRSRDVIAYQGALHRESARSRPFKPPALTIDMLAVVAGMAPDASRGALPGGMADQLRQKFGSEPGLSKAVAADALRYVSASVNAARSSELSPTYRWRYFAVRTDCGHADREGQVFAWAEPPPGGHPGQSVGCMCMAEADLPDYRDLLKMIRY